MTSKVHQSKASAMTRLLAMLLAPITGLWAFTESYVRRNLHRIPGNRLQNVAIFNTGAIFEGVLGKILTLIIVFAILGGTAVTFFSNLKTLVVAFNNTSATGNTTVDGFVAIFGLIVAILGVFGLIKIVQLAAKE